MSLIDAMATDVCLLSKTQVSDGAGGYEVAWTTGTPFKAAITFDSSMQAKVAESQGVKSLYTVTVPRARTLKYHDVIKRISDGAIFRVTSNIKDKMSPVGCGLNMAQVSAESWEVPTSDEG